MWGGRRKFWRMLGGWTRSRSRSERPSYRITVNDIDDRCSIEELERFIGLSQVIHIATKCRHQGLLLHVPIALKGGLKRDLDIPQADPKAIEPTIVRIPGRRCKVPFTEPT